MSKLIRTVNLLGTLAYSHATTVRLIDKLTAQGLVERREATDRRVISLHLVKAAAAALLVAAGFSEPSRADEAGISFWLPGQFGSLAAVAGQPGWSLQTAYYHATAGASGSVAAADEMTIGRFNPPANVNMNINVTGRADMILLTPTYTFATPILGGRLAVGMTGIFGRSATSLDDTRTASTGGLETIRQGSISDSLVGVGDLYPTGTMLWNADVNNFMTYLTGGIPVGAYAPNRLASIGIGHGAIDAGGGYTYFNPISGQEFSAVAGLTYNFKNPDTRYQSGVDFHIDWAASQFLSEQVFVGLVGYYYNQLTNDSGALPVFDGFKSRVAAVGPQIGYLFPVGNMQGYLNLKGYAEFDAANRASDWNTWLTFAISPAAPESHVAPTRRMFTK
jgi:hypothetical protein